MKNFFKNLFILTSCAFAFSSFANTNKSMPAVLCVDAVDLWDGAYTIEITNPDENGQVFGEVYEQAEEGRNLVAAVNLKKELSGSQLLYSGENFKLNISMESFVPTNKHSATFSYGNAEQNINGNYTCLSF